MNPSRVKFSEFALRATAPNSIRPTLPAVPKVRSSASVVSSTARRSTSVIPVGTHTIARDESGRPPHAIVRSSAASARPSRGRPRRRCGAAGSRGSSPACGRSSAAPPCRSLDAASPRRTRRRRLEHDDALAAAEHDRVRRAEIDGKVVPAELPQPRRKERRHAQSGTPRPSLATARLSGRRGARAPEHEAPAPDALRCGEEEARSRPAEKARPGPPGSLELRRNPLSATRARVTCSRGSGGYSICASISFETSVS